MATRLGLGALVVRLILLSVGENSDLVKTIGVVLAAAGVSIGSVTGALKNSAQSMLVRLRQDTYTDLAARGHHGAAIGHDKATCARQWPAETDTDHRNLTHEAAANRTRDWTVPGQSDRFRLRQAWMACMLVSH